jgi:hypothetical protein
MSHLATRTINLARQTADHLAREGQARHAENVRALIRSNATYRGTLQQLHRDNLELRAALQQREAR